MPARRRGAKTAIRAGVQVRRIYESGLTCAQIASILLVDETTVRRWLKEAGAQLRRRGPRSGVHQDARAAVRTSSRTAAFRAQELVDGGASVTTAARTVGLARQTLYRHGVRRGHRGRNRT